MRKRFKKIGLWYKYIPTALTIGNSLIGFAAILNCLHLYGPAGESDWKGYLTRSAGLIIFAMVFDMLDGWAARMLNATSEHGMQMDSLADMVTFGVAPAVLVAVMADNAFLDVVPKQIVWLMSAVFLACVACRLALYNVLAMNPIPEGKPKSKSFHGLPSPGGAAAVCSMVLLLSLESSLGLIVQLLPWYVGVLGFLMVSPIPYFHVGKWLGSKRRNTVKILVVIGVALCFKWEGILTTAILVNGYVLSGPLYAIFRWLVPPAGPDDDELEEELVAE